MKWAELLYEGFWMIDQVICMTNIEFGAQIGHAGQRREVREECKRRDDQVVANIEQQQEQIVATHLRLGGTARAGRRQRSKMLLFKKMARHLSKLSAPRVTTVAWGKASQMTCMEREAGPLRSSTKQ